MFEVHISNHSPSRSRLVCVVVVCCGGVRCVLCVLLCCGGACVWCVVKLGILSLSCSLSFLFSFPFFVSLIFFLIYLSFSLFFFFFFFSCSFSYSCSCSCSFSFSSFFSLPFYSLFSSLPFTPTNTVQSTDQQTRRPTLRRLNVMWRTAGAQQSVLSPPPPLHSLPPPFSPSPPPQKKVGDFLSQEYFRRGIYFYYSF